MYDIIIAGVIVLMVVIAAFYVYKSKKNGTKCTGCPGGCSCDSKNSCICSNQDK